MPRGPFHPSNHSLMNEGMWEILSSAQSVQLIDACYKEFDLTPNSSLGEVSRSMESYLQGVDPAEDKSKVYANASSFINYIDRQKAWFSPLNPKCMNETIYKTLTPL